MKTYWGLKITKIIRQLSVYSLGTTGHLRSSDVLAFFNSDFFIISIGTIFAMGTELSQFSVVCKYCIVIYFRVNYLDSYFTKFKKKKVMTKWKRFGVKMIRVI
jgi:hypothetical protein